MASEKTIDLVINYLTQEQFNNLSTKNADEIYLTPDDSITTVSAGSGLSGGGSSGNITLNHSNSVTGKTTQAIYPISFDDQGHITGAGSAVTPLTSHNTYTINTSGSGNAVTGISLNGTTFTVTKGTTFLTSHSTYTVNTTGEGNAITALSLSGTTFTATKGTTFLTSHQTIKQDGVTGATGNHFGVCSTGASTAAKTVTITSGDVTLEAGLRVIVKFDNANTATTAPTLNVNSKGAKNIYHNGAQITTGANKSLLAGTVEFVYDGTQWQLVGNYINTTYTIPTTAGSAETNITASTTANKVTVGSHSTDYGVTNAGSGDASFNAKVTSHVLSFEFSHSHTAPTLGSKVPTVSSVSATVSITDPGHTHTLS